MKPQDFTERIDPKEEPTRAELAKQAVVTEEFLFRTRRYRRLTQPAKKIQLANGLDSKPEDFA